MLSIRDYLVARDRVYAYFGFDGAVADKKTNMFQFCGKEVEVPEVCARDVAEFEEYILSRLYLADDRNVVGLWLNQYKVFKVVDKNFNHSANYYSVQNIYEVLKTGYLCTYDKTHLAGSEFYTIKSLDRDVVVDVVLENNGFTLNSQRRVKTEKLFPGGLDCSYSIYSHESGKFVSIIANISYQGRVVENKAKVYAIEKDDISVPLIGWCRDKNLLFTVVNMSLSDMLDCLKSVYVLKDIDTDDVNTMSQLFNHSSLMGIMSPFFISTIYSDIDNSSIQLLSDLCKDLICWKMQRLTTTSLVECYLNHANQKNMGDSVKSYIRELDSSICSIIE